MLIFSPFPVASARRHHVFVAPGPQDGVGVAVGLASVPHGVQAGGLVAGVAGAQQSPFELVGGSDHRISCRGGG